MAHLEYEVAGSNATIPLGDDFDKQQVWDLIRELEAQGEAVTDRWLCFTTKGGGSIILPGNRVAAIHFEAGE